MKPTIIPIWMHYEHEFSITQHNYKDSNFIMFCAWKNEINTLGEHLVAIFKVKPKTK